MVRGRSCLGTALSTRPLLIFSLTPSPWAQQPFCLLLHRHRTLLGTWVLRSVTVCSPFIVLSYPPFS